MSKGRMREFSQAVRVIHLRSSGECLNVCCLSDCGRISTSLASGIR
jgi:hypothetical protein